MDLHLDAVTVTADGHQLVRKLSLTVGRGETVGLVGPNGSGKSTALRCVYRALRPTRRATGRGTPAPDGYVEVDEFAQTTVAGVSAAGDVARLPALPDGLTLVSQAAADGVRAVWLEQAMVRVGRLVPLG